LEAYLEVILSLKFDVLNNVKTEVVEGKREYRIPFSIVGETTFTEPQLLGVRERQALTNAILSRVKDLIELELSERVIESNPTSGEGTRQDQEPGTVTGGPDRQDVTSESGGQGPVQRDSPAALADKDQGPSGSVSWPG